MSKIITGLFESPSDAAIAVDHLMVRGVPQSAISVLAADHVSRDGFAVRTKSKVAEGAAIGAGTAGGIMAIIAGFTAVGALATTGVGILAAGPIVAALAGAGIGAVGGGLVGGLIGLGLPEHEVKFYEDAIAKGHVLVGVDCDDCDVDTKVIKEVLDEYGASKVATA